MFNDIDEAVVHADVGAERRLVGDVLENSPYPEVYPCQCLAVVEFDKAIRCAPLCVITTLMCPQTPFAPG